MAALAYVLPPLSGMIAFFTGGRRVRVHGSQAVVLGALWPALVYLGSLLSPGVTQAAFVVGAAVWLVMIVTTALGRDLTIPWLRARISDQRFSI